jgi:hypothetical protein
MMRRWSTALQPIPNTQPQLGMEGMEFVMRSSAGQQVRCLILREVFDDRVRRDAAIHSLSYFRDHADAFYRTVQRKFDAGEVAENDRIIISNVDVDHAHLPDMRRRL